MAELFAMYRNCLALEGCKCQNIRIQKKEGMINVHPKKLSVFLLLYSRCICFCTLFFAHNQKLYWKTDT